MSKKLESRKGSVKDAIKAGVRPKKTKKEVAAKNAAKREIAAAAGEAAATETPVQKATRAVRASKENKSVEAKAHDTVSTLPEKQQHSYIKAKITGEVRMIDVDIKTIKATSQTVYVADIHAQNPDILSIVYWIIMPNTQHVVLRVLKEDYEALLKRKEAQSMNHLYSVVDNAVFPSLTYGSWKLNDIKDFPTQDQIREYDAKFRTMDVVIHNQPVVGKVSDKESVEEDEDEDFEIDFTLDGDEEDEQDEFDFEED